MKLRLRLDTGFGEQGQRFIEDAALGNGEGEGASHDARALAGRGGQGKDLGGHTPSPLREKDMEPYRTE